MCNDYAREIEAGRVKRVMEEMRDMPPFDYVGGRIPNDAGATRHVKIGDKGLVVRLQEYRLEGEMITWAWKAGPYNKPVFNFKSEGRDFSKSDRCLILATGFYEYTAPVRLGVKLKDQHFFTLKGQNWFWIAGLIKSDAFTMLTTSPGPDMKPYHDRQICVLAPSDGMAWLSLSKPEPTILRPLPSGRLKHVQLRKDGVNLL